MEKRSVQAIETPRLILRAFARPPADESVPDERWTADLHFFADVRTDYGTAKWGSDEQLDQDLEATAVYLRERSGYAWSFVIELKKDHDGSATARGATNGADGAEPQPKPRHVGVEGRQLLGAAGIKLPDENQKYADRFSMPMLGYFMHKDGRGQGYMTEAAKALITAFWQGKDRFQKEQGIEYPWAGIEAETDTENIASTRVMQKCGFTLVSTKEKSFYSPLLKSERDCFHFLITPPPPWEMEISVTPMPAEHSSGN